MNRAAAAGLFIAALASSPIASSLEPESVAGTEACAECHKLEVGVWKKTAHHLGFFTMHKSATAKAIAGKLGIKRIKRDPSCIRCHYTPAIRRKTIKAASGVGCESCHGGARGWLDRHAEYGGPVATAATETRTHKDARRDDCIAAGMRARFNLVDLANGCFDCHVVADEKLVNDGGHPASSRLELVAETQGTIRHNFFFSTEKQNRTVAVDHRRTLYAVGQALALEHSLRGLATASGPGRYADEMSTIARDARRQLARIGEIAAVAPIESILALVGESTPLAPGNVALLDLAVQVASAAESIATTDADSLAGIDPLLPDVSSAPSP